MIPKLAFGDIIDQIDRRVDPATPHSGHPTLEETRRRFEVLAFSLTITPIGTGRYVACASDATSGRGPVAVGDTPEASAAAAWQRFNEHRPYYTGVSERSDS